jgi:hypothetical protein
MISRGSFLKRLFGGIIAAAAVPQLAPAAKRVEKCARQVVPETNPVCRGGKLVYRGGLGEQAGLSNWRPINAAERRAYDVGFDPGADYDFRQSISFRVEKNPDGTTKLTRINT